MARPTLSNPLAPLKPAARTRSDSRLGGLGSGLLLMALSGCGSDQPLAGDVSIDLDQAKDENVRSEPIPLKRLYRAPDNLFCPGLDGGSCPGLAADLEFNPSRRGELWIAFRQPYDDEPCDAPSQAGPGDQQAGCSLLRSTTAIIADALGEASDVLVKEDGNSWHFMRRVTALAFADNGTFATVGESRTGNYLNQLNDYMGPTWWSADLEIYGEEFFVLDEDGNEREPLNGSHLDMLHATPYGMGIAHQSDSVFWCFNGDAGSIDRYDFKQPHEPGGEDHSDGTYHQYATGELLRERDVPSHMAFDATGRWLFVADSGNQRIVRLDTTSGEEAGPIATPDAQIAAPTLMSGAKLETIVAKGTIGLPSGLETAEDHLLVTDAQAGDVLVFSLDGELQATLPTGLPAGSLAGITVGPDGHIYLVNWYEAEVLRATETLEELLELYAE